MPNNVNITSLLHSVTGGSLWRKITLQSNVLNSHMRNVLWLAVVPVLNFVTPQEHFVTGTVYLQASNTVKINLTLTLSQTLFTLAHLRIFILCYTNVLIIIIITVHLTSQLL